MYLAQNVAKLHHSVALMASLNQGSFTLTVQRVTWTRLLSIIEPKYQNNHSRQNISNDL